MLAVEPAVVSVDAGPMRGSRVGTPTLAIVGNDAEAVGASPIRLWLPRSSSLTRTVSSSSCNCNDNRFRNDDCCCHPMLHGGRGCPASGPLVGGNAGMNLLVVTALYPPGTGRLWTLDRGFRLGLIDRDHSIRC